MDYTITWRSLCAGKKVADFFGAIEVAAHGHKIQPKKNAFFLAADRQHLYLLSHIYVHDQGCSPRINHPKRGVLTNPRISFAPQALKMLPFVLVLCIWEIGKLICDHPLSPFIIFDFAN